MIGMLRAEARRLLTTAAWSLAGWRAAWASEKSLRQWTGVNVLSAALAFMIDMTPAERALILALGLVVLAAELINTAIEEVVDLARPEIDPRAKKAKDCGSAGVVLAALAGAAAWLVVLLG